MIHPLPKNHLPSEEISISSTSLGTQASQRNEELTVNDSPPSIVRSACPLEANKLPLLLSVNQLRVYLQPSSIPIFQDKMLQEHTFLHDGYLATFSFTNSKRIDYHHATHRLFPDRNHYRKLTRKKLQIPSYLHGRNLHRKCKHKKIKVIHTYHDRNFHRKYTRKKQNLKTDHPQPLAFQQQCKSLKDRIRRHSLQ